MIKNLTSFCIFLDNNNNNKKLAFSMALALLYTSGREYVFGLRGSQHYNSWP